MANCWMMSYMGYMACENCYTCQEKFPKFNSKIYIGFTNYKKSGRGKLNQCEYWVAYDYFYSIGKDKYFRSGAFYTYMAFKVRADIFQKNRVGFIRHLKKEVAQWIPAG